MTVTLGELYDIAHQRLGQSAATLELPRDDPFAHTVALGQVDALVQHARLLLHGSASHADPTALNTSRLLDQAQRSLLAAARRLPHVDPDLAQASGGPLDTSLQATGAVIDLIRGHRDSTGAPVTPYALAFTTRPARAYHLRHVARIAEAAGAIVHRVSETVSDRKTRGRLRTVRDFLDHGSLQARADSADADLTLAAFPQAPSLTPVASLPSDTLTQAAAQIRTDCEQLSRAAYETLHGKGDQSPSGSDLQELAQWRSLGTMLAGRLLVQAATDAPDHVAAVLRNCADQLRSVAHTWRTVQEQWLRVVDIEDPRVHPRLPRPSYEMIRRGEIPRMPRGTAGHPVAEIARASTLRTGRLLFGNDWYPNASDRPATPRAGSAIVADAGGIAELTQTVYRITATDWRLAVAAPHALTSIEHRLVTDIPEHCPPGHPYRYYQVPGHRLDRTISTYRQLRTAQQAAANSLISVAPHTGMDTVRPRLDAAAHRHITNQTWGAPTTATVAAPPATPASDVRRVEGRATRASTHEQGIGVDQAVAKVLAAAEGSSRDAGPVRPAGVDGSAAPMLDAPRDADATVVDGQRASRLAALSFPSPASEATASQPAERSGDISRGSYPAFHRPAEHDRGGR